MDINIMANFSSIYIPTTGVTAASLNVTPESLGVKTGIANTMQEVTDGSRYPYHVPTITSTQNRAQGWAYTWSSGESWTNYHSYLTGSTQADCERAFWLSLGTNNRQNTLSYSSTSDNGVIEYAKNSVVGGERTYSQYNNSSNYNPMRQRTMFLRNFHPTLTKTITMYGHYSNYWSAGYEGSGVAIGTPSYSTGTKYSAANGMSWTVPVNRTGGNSYYTWSWNVTIPAQQSVVVTQSNSMWYWRSNNCIDINKFYSLEQTFGDYWIQPDLRLTEAATTYNDFNNQFNTITSWRIWNRAALLGDR
jgi:hypothetical protein